MTTKLDPANVALRRDPYTRQEVLQGPDGMMVGWTGEVSRLWEADGSSWSNNSEIDLIPLQTRPAALRCWAYVNTDGQMAGYSLTECRNAVREMIERDPAEAMARALAGLDRDAQTAALTAYRAAYPEDGK